MKIGGKKYVKILNLQVRKTASMRSEGSSTIPLTATAQSQQNVINPNQYALPIRNNQTGNGGNVDVTTSQTNTLNAPPIPDPDYSLSESDDEENSVMLAKNIKNNAVETNGQNNLGLIAETSGNSNTR